ncbi:30S ribosomal protein S9 [Blastopirellula sp. JC732]|uniref:Small ribosomal subunit protein uS9 n=1 Tax=Blastopirellula sediminis TaxID=2894196 RepID=A0A9X1MKB8_9BACT|nr:30S ribosomal protein S9 [Blastopirellula sediminis]MCC9609707.1 30S ribosomal protein S9 [Blastopirellula sediminis]MCC9627517.1 30S ribosomal protein S9 [Blastopirellula sediminis]
MSTDETNVETPAAEAPVEAAPAPVKKAKSSDGVILGTGRRKTSVARVRIKSGSGKISINGRSLEDFFPNIQDQAAFMGPLVDTGYAEKLDVRVLVNGGGTSGQAGACRMGLGRALAALDDAAFPALRENGHLTRDSRMKERKKYGLRGARRGTQFSKR